MGTSNIECSDKEVTYEGKCPVFKPVHASPGLKQFLLPFLAQIWNTRKQFLEVDKILLASRNWSLEAPGHPPVEIISWDRKVEVAEIAA